MNPTIEAFLEKVTPCKLREYIYSDREACIEIYRTNEPDFITPGFIHEFESYLDEPKSYFLVVEQEEGIVGCGGLELWGDAPHAAGLSFGMIRKDHHRKGLGTSLLAARISLLGEEKELHMETSLEAVGFYARYGFELDSVTPNRLGKGVDYGNLVLDLDPDFISGIRSLLTSTAIELKINELEQ